MQHWDQDDLRGQPVRATRRARGQMAHLSGAAAEDSVARDYERRGYQIAERRWRGLSGEIDLIFRKDGVVIFVEVKAARDFDTALASLGTRQIGRICRAAEEYVGGEPAGSLTDIRLDVGLVDGVGDLRILENALAA